MLGSEHSSLPSKHLVTIKSHSITLWLPPKITTTTTKLYIELKKEAPGLVKREDMLCNFVIQIGQGVWDDDLNKNLKSVPRAHFNSK